MVSYCDTGPNPLSYWADSPSYLSAQLPYPSTVAKDATVSPPYSSHGLFEYDRRLQTAQGEIRLIHLQPRQHGRDLSVECNIVYVSIDKTPAYLALSYRWGDATDTQPILVNGKRFNVTKNLALALKQLRLERNILVLWVDAICINQEDFEERAEQVQRMDTIYRQAALVLAWLGEAADGSEDAMKSLDRLGKHCVFRIPQDENFHSHRRQYMSRLLAADTKPKFPLPSVIALFRLDWWSRVWCLQEVHLAKDVIFICGNLGMPIGILLNAYEAISEFGIGTGVGDALYEIAKSIRIELLSKPPEMFRAATPVKGRGSPAQTSEPLKARIGRSNGMAATNPRDHIFALLSVASDVDKLGVHPDYTKSPNVVYAEVAASLIQAYSDLQILCWCQSLMKRPDGLPSWVPDFSVRFHNPLWNVRDVLFSAGKNTAVSARVDSDETLTIKGAEFDTLNEIGRPGMGEDGEMTSLLDIIRLADNRKVAYGTDNDLHEAIWRTPIADLEPTLRTDNDRHYTRANYRLYRGFQALNHSRAPPAGVEDERTWRRKESEDYRIAMSVISLGRQAFVTTRGYLGIGPQGIRQEDRVCIFYGAAVPFIVRECSRGYQLIGECYVHGIMDGEFMDMDQSNDELEIVLL